MMLRRPPKARRRPPHLLGLSWVEWANITTPPIDREGGIVYDEGMTTTQPTTNTGRRFNLTPTDRYAAGGAVHQDGNLKVHTCECGTPVVWATSARTGRRYLAVCATNQAGGYFYIKANAHTWDSHMNRMGHTAAAQTRQERMDDLADRLANAQRHAAAAEPGSPNHTAALNAAMKILEEMGR